MNDQEKQLLSLFKRYEREGKFGKKGDNDRPYVDPTTMSDAEKISMAQSMSAMDTELATRAGQRAGASRRDAVDVDRIELIGSPNYKPGYGYKGFYFGDDYVQNQQTAQTFKTAWHLPKDWHVEDDTVALFPEGRNLDTIAHEFGHRDEGHDVDRHYTREEHDLQYLLDAWTARTRTEWNDTIESIAAYKGIKATPENLAKIEQETLASIKANADMLSELEGASLAERYETDAEDESARQREIGQTRVSAASGTPLNFHDNEEDD